MNYLSELIMIKNIHHLFRILIDTKLCFISKENSNEIIVMHAETGQPYGSYSQHYFAVRDAELLHIMTDTILYISLVRDFKQARNTLIW